MISRLRYLPRLAFGSYRALRRLGMDRKTAAYHVAKISQEYLRAPQWVREPAWWV